MKLPSLLLALLLPAAAAAAQCQPRWSDEFPIAELRGHTYAFQVVTLGGDPTLFAGSFSGSPGLARWSGQTWVPLSMPSNLGPNVTAMTVYDAGSGPALYIAGINNDLARWDGAAWTTIATPNGIIRDLAVFDAGAGPRLLATGEFTAIGSTAAAAIGQWDGRRWSALGTGLGTSGTPLYVAGWRLSAVQEGPLAGLYVAGQFSLAGGLPAMNIARWDGAAWSPLGGGLTGATDPVRALEALDESSGLAIYAGGSFTTAGGSPANLIAKWNGTTWSALGGGPSSTGYVASLAVHSDASGPRLYAGGVLDNGNIARWDGGSWSPLGTGTDGRVSALMTFDFGQGPELLAGGQFSSAGSGTAYGAAKWNGSGWRPLAKGGLDGAVQSLRLLDPVGGPAMYMVGGFSDVGGQRVSGLVARRDGQWIDFGPPDVASVSVLHEQGESFLVASGDFVPGQPTLARWAGAQWQPMGGPLLTLQLLQPASPASMSLFGCGGRAGGFGRSVVRWTGSDWEPVVGGAFSYSTAHAAIVFDAGSGPEYFIAGDFRIARWNGSYLVHLASAPYSGTGLVPYFYSLAVYDDGRGPALYVGGRFPSVNGVPANNIAKWHNGAWAPLGSGLGGTQLPTAYAMAVFDDGRGQALYVGGEDITSAGGVPVRNLARWDGRAWEDVGDGVNGRVYALASFDDGRGPSLWVGGTFTTAGPYSSGRLARWLPCTSSCYANCDNSTGPGGTPTLNLADFVCFLNRFAAGDARANCDGSTAPPVLNVADFTCFLNRYAARCP